MLDDLVETAPQRPVEGLASSCSAESTRIVLGLGGLARNRSTQPTRWPSAASWSASRSKDGVNPHHEWMITTGAPVDTAGSARYLSACRSDGGSRRLAEGAISSIVASKLVLAQGPRTPATASDHGHAVVTDAGQAPIRGPRAGHGGCRLRGADDDPLGQRAVDVLTLPGLVSTMPPPPKNLSQRRPA